MPLHLNKVVIAVTAGQLKALRNPERDPGDGKRDCRDALNAKGFLEPDDSSRQSWPKRFKRTDRGELLRRALDNIRLPEGET